MSYTHFQIARGVFANLPTLEAGELAWTTDTHTLYCGDGSTNHAIGPSGGGSGTVTSVALSMPSIFSVSGSPITTSGTFTVTLATETANVVFAGPASGSAAAPTFRALVPADLPVFGASGASHSAGAVPDPGSTAGSTRFLCENGTWVTPGGSGTVTSVGLTMPGIFSVAGSPVTASGSLIVSLATETANTLFAGPTSGSSAAPTFRSLVTADLPDAAWPGRCDGRLTLSSTLPITVADTNGTTIYFLPYKGSRICYYDGTKWDVVTIPSAGWSVAVPTLKTKRYDVFFTGTGITTTDWKTVGATNSPTAGSNKVINVSNTTGVSVGDTIGVADGSGNAEEATVTSISAGISVTVATLVNSYTTPTLCYNSRQTSLVLQDGVWVQSGTNYLYLGSGYVYTVSAGKTYDTAFMRGLWNYYHRVQRTLSIYDSTSDWVYGSNTVRPANANTGNRVSAIIGLQEASCHLHLTWVAKNLNTTTAEGSVAGFALDNITTLVDGFGKNLSLNPNGYGTGHSIYDDYPSIGCHYWQWVEANSANIDTFGYTANNVKSGITGWIMG